MYTDFFISLDSAIDSYNSLNIKIAAIIVGLENAVKIKELYKVLFVEDSTDLSQRLDIMNQVTLNRLSYKGIPILVSDKSIQFQFVFENEVDARRISNMKDIGAGLLPDNVIPFPKK